MTLNEYQVLTTETATFAQSIDKAFEPVVNAVEASAVIFEARRAARDGLVTIQANLGLIYTTMGLAGEAGEVADQAKRIVRDDNFVLTEARRDKLIRESGDVFWYLAQLATALGVTLEEVARINIAKLKARQEQGKLKGEGDNR
jgi:NTP pyrophosphatase (non-canonical NTP hydrolase)